MRETLNGVVFAAVAALATTMTPSGLVQDTVVQHRQVADVAPAETPPAPHLQGDPADSLYRAARTALGSRDFQRAADLFARIPARHPRSAYAVDALYWQAFALYRLGGDEQLRSAMAALTTQRSKYPKAATRGDAAALERRIQGALARRGDEDAAREIADAARDIADAGQDAAEAGQAAVEAGQMAAEAGQAAARRVSGGSQCADDDDDMKLAALNALLQMDSDRAAPILAKVLARRDAASVCLRRKAVFLVAQHEADGAEDVLLKAARSDPDAEVREQAVFWLSQVGTDQAAAALDSILRTTKDPGVQDKAVFALSQHGSAAARTALHAYAGRSDVPESAREKAIFWIGQSGEEEDATFLRALYGKLRSEELKKKVLFSVSQMGTRESTAWLVQVARTRAEPLELRKQALFWAGQNGASSSELASLYDSFTDRELREHLIFVLSQQGDRDAADKLVEIAKRDADPALRKKALFWLGQIDDPRAADVLEEIIQQ